MRRIGTITALLFLILSIPVRINGRNRNIAADSLNMIALRWLPVNLDSAQLYACQAQQTCGRRSSAHAMATNILGDVEFARMNYVSASYNYELVLKHSRNKIEWLVADVGMMNICQRISDNMSFYLYRDKALLELRGIMAELESLSDLERKRALSAATDLRIVSAMYFNTVEQPAQAELELTQIDESDRQAVDTLRSLRLGNMAGESVSEKIDYLCNINKTAVGSGYLCQSALALQKIASLLLENGPDADAAMSQLGAAEINPSGLEHYLLIEQLLLKSLRSFLKYGSMYGAVENYCLLGTCANEKEDYNAAVEWLTNALDILNVSRDAAISGLDDLPYLERYRSDNIVVENEWVAQVPWIAVPECMSRIREQMSLAYSGLGNKAASDYNRNVYLELQKTIRLDRRFEARQQMLRRMNRSLNAVLIGVACGTVFLLFFLTLFLRLVGKRNKRYQTVMEKVLRLCGKILSIHRSDDSDAAKQIAGVLNNEMAPLIGADSIRIELSGNDSVSLKCEGGRLIRDGQSLLDMAAPFVGAALQGARTMERINARQLIAGKEQYLAFAHTEENKRQNLLRRTCCSVLSDCRPLIDRMVAESMRLESSDSWYQNRVEYIGELAQQAELYNAVLTKWGRLCIGEVRLHIENFALQPLFDIIARSSRSYLNKGVTLNVCGTDSVIKADKTLTLFMLNTLSDNARKFTPSGGAVTVQAIDGDGWVEIAVSDTGVGLSSDDVRALKEEKVYDPRHIGDASGDKSAKGSGFGLMNCRGIIDKYRKSGAPFDCCTFNVESVPGKGSRFSFRLPKGVRRLLSIVALAVFSSAASAETDDFFLEQAYASADSLYECNVSGDHLQALVFADEAVRYLNEDYKRLSNNDTLLISLLSDNVPAEQKWLESGFGTDYETILWIRNEVAVAALALHDMAMYKYNNDAYLTLFRMFYSEDKIESDCLQLQRSNSNMRIAIAVLILIFLALGVFRYVLYSRNSLRYRSDMHQLLGVTGHISSLLSETADSDRYDFQNMADNLSGILYNDLGLMVRIDSVCIAIVNEGRTYFSFNGSMRQESLMKSLVADYVENDRRDNCFSDGIAVLPLIVSDDGIGDFAGAFAASISGVPDKADEFVLGAVASYMADAIHNCVLRLSSEYRSLEQIREVSERLSFEENRLHIQNMVLDNCLSTLRHETLSYPSRIAQLAGRMLDAGRDRQTDIADMRELTSYYRDIYEILGRNVSRQLDEFRVCDSEKIKVSEVLRGTASKYSERMPDGIVLEVCYDAPDCTGDSVFLRCLLENLVEQSLETRIAGRLRLGAYSDGDFVRFCFDDCRQGIPTENMDMLFSPVWSMDNLRYSTCRQIIRELDESMGHPGCRINAEPLSDGGLTIWFTLPDNNYIWKHSD